MMAADDSSTKRNSNVQLLEKLEALSETLNQYSQISNTSRRTASLAIPRASPPFVSSAEDHDNDTAKVNNNKQSNKRSLSRDFLSGN